MAANKADSNSSESTNSLATMTPDILLTMIQKVVSDSITNIITGENGALHQVKNEIVNHLDNKLEHFENQITELQSENSTLKSKLLSQKSEIDELREESVILKSQIKQALVHANNNEQYSRKTCIRIIGYPVAQNPQYKDCRKLSCELFMNKMCIPVEEGDIAGAHRVGKIVDGKQSIIVKFFARDTKQLVTENRFKLKGTNIRIYDDLTIENRKLLNRLRNHSEIESAWYFNGKIKAKTINGLVFNADIYTDINATCNKLNRERRQRPPSNTDSFLFSDPIRADRVVSPDQEQMDVDSSSRVNHLSRSAGTSNS